MMLRGIRRKVAGNGRAFASLTSRDRRRCNLRGEFLEMPAFVYGKIGRVCMSEIIEVGEQLNGQQIALLQQQTLRVTLPEVRTAGFRWVLRTYSPQILTLLTDDLEAEPGVAGGAAQHHWVFRAEQVGSTELAFNYTRPWVRAAAAARTFSVSVRVSASSSDAAEGSP
jgi:predicted secreted protein